MNNETFVYLRLIMSAFLIVLSSIYSHTVEAEENTSSSWYIGLGAFSAKIASNNQAFDGSDGNGGHAVGGITFGRFSLEASMATYDFRTTLPPPDINYPPDDANYGYFAFGAKFDLLDINKSKWSPWLALTIATHDLGLSNYVYSLMGDCTAPMFGVDIRLLKWLDLRASKYSCSFNTNESTYDSYSSKFDSDSYAMDLVFRFQI